jgi:hypothetical protein
MNPDEYNRICEEMALSPIDVGEKLGVTWRTAYRWKAGDCPIDETAARVLRYFRDEKIPLEELEKRASK